MQLELGSSEVLIEAFLAYCRQMESQESLQNLFQLVDNVEAQLPEDGDKEGYNEKTKESQGRLQIRDCLIGS